MLTNKKYKSDKILKAILIIIGLSVLVAYFTHQRQGVIIGLVFIAGAFFFGFATFRYFKEGNKKAGYLGLAAYIIYISLIIYLIRFLNIQL
jgi:Ca2+/Na+ antiporter